MLQNTHINCFSKASSVSVHPPFPAPHQPPQVPPDTASEPVGQTALLLISSSSQASR